jgi:hypothetical protein
MVKKQSSGSIAELTEDKRSGRFSREIRMNQNGCPLCNFVQGELERSDSIAIEEWIYLAHIKNAHGLIP